jgi:hypothetical protein
MEERIEQLEKSVSLLQGEINELKGLIASGFKKVESNLGSIGMSVGIRVTKLTDEINKIS